MAIPDGKPATDFSAMNREWVRTVATEAAESGSIGLPPVTADDNGKILGVVNGAWGAMDAGGGGSSDFSTAEVTVTVTGDRPDPLEFYGSCIVDDELAGFTEVSETGTITFVLYKGKSQEIEVGVGDNENITVTGGITYDDGIMYITGDGTLTDNYG